MKALIEEGEQEIGIKMQGLALAEGNYIIHLIININTYSNPMSENFMISILFHLIFKF